MATQTPSILCNSLSSNARGICSQNIVIIIGKSELKSSFCAILSHCFASESLAHLPRSSVNTHHWPSHFCSKFSLDLALMKSAKEFSADEVVPTRRLLEIFRLLCRQFLEFTFKDHFFAKKSFEGQNMNHFIYL